MSGGNGFRLRHLFARPAEFQHSAETVEEHAESFPRLLGVIKLAPREHAGLAQHLVGNADVVAVFGENLRKLTRETFFDGNECDARVPGDLLHEEVGTPVILLVEVGSVPAQECGWAHGPGFFLVELHDDLRLHDGGVGDRFRNLFRGGRRYLGDREDFHLLDIVDAVREIHLDHPVKRLQPVVHLLGHPVVFREHLPLGRACFERPVGPGGDETLRGCEDLQDRPVVLVFDKRHGDAIGQRVVAEDARPEIIHIGGDFRLLDVLEFQHSLFREGEFGAKEDLRRVMHEHLLRGLLQEIFHLGHERESVFSDVEAGSEGRCRPASGAREFMPRLRGFEEDDREAVDDLRVLPVGVLAHLDTEVGRRGVTPGDGVEAFLAIHQVKDARVPAFVHTDVELPRVDLAFMLGFPQLAKSPFPALADKGVLHVLADASAPVRVLLAMLLPLFLFFLGFRHV
ncbi:MAG: hypothetical protein QG653_494 [Patescibacteria group bacterium]|nr:hypothetical protein [Patescibacteria group bacterium]